jgi:hypothetical protein
MEMPHRAQRPTPTGRFSSDSLLVECDPDPEPVAPRDPASALDHVRLDEEGEIVGDERRL